MVARSRCLLVWSVTTAACTTTAWWAWSGVTPGDTFDRLVASVCGVALAACATWAWLVCTVVTAQALGRPERALRPTRGVPTWAVRAVLLACGVAVVAAVPAQASSGTHPAIDTEVHHLARHAPDARPDARPDTRPDASADGLPYPDRAVGPARATAAPAAAPTATPAGPARATGAIVVRAGDSLWSLAADLVGPAADDAEVAAVVARLYDLNRAVVGPDPDLIHPGLHLRTPGS